MRFSWSKRCEAVGISSTSSTSSNISSRSSGVTSSSKTDLVLGVRTKAGEDVLKNFEAATEDEGEEEEVAA